MAERKTFGINTEPHVAQIGDDIELEFKPEMLGDEFMDAYAGLQAGYVELGLNLGTKTAENLDVEKLRKAITLLREYLAELMMPYSKTEFLGEKNVDTGEYAGGLKLPYRVLLELLQWTMEIYGGGKGLGGSSSNSSADSSSPGSSSTGRSRSKGSTRAAGR